MPQIDVAGVAGGADSGGPAASGRVDPLRAEVDLLRVEADLLGAQADPLRRATLLVVGVGYAPNATGAAPYTTTMARDLATVAGRVVVFTGAPTHPGPVLSRLRPGPRRVITHDGGVQLVRHRYLSPAGGGGLALAGSERAFLRAVLATPVPTAPDVVIGLLPTAASAVAAARIAQRFTAPLVLVVQNLAAAGSPGMPPGAALATGQLDALRQAARVIAVSNKMRAVVIAQGVGQERVELLADWSPNRPDDEGLTADAARSRLGLARDGFVVAHVGNIGSDQDVPTVVAAMHAATAVGVGDPTAAPTRLLVVGEGSERAQLELATAHRPDIHFCDPVTASRYPALLAAADVLVVAERPGRPDPTLPSRIRSYLNAGRPVVAAVNPGREVGLGLDPVSGAVLAVAPGAAGALAHALVRLRDDPEGRARMCAAARGYAGDRRSPAKGGAAVAAGAAVGGPSATERLRDVLRSVLTGSPA